MPQIEIKRRKAGITEQSDSEGYCYVVHITPSPGETLIPAKELNAFNLGLQFSEGAANFSRISESTPDRQKAEQVVEKLRQMDLLKSPTPGETAPRETSGPRGGGLRGSFGIGETSG